MNEFNLSWFQTKYVLAVEGREMVNSSKLAAEEDDFVHDRCQIIEVDFDECKR